MSLIPPTHAGQVRVVRINTRVPIYVEMEAIYDLDLSSLQWRTVRIVSEEGALHADVSALPTTTATRPAG